MNEQKTPQEQRYARLVDELTPGSRHLRGCLRAFWVGGLICALCQILLDRTKMLPGRIMVTLVCTGAVLSFLGLYDPFAEYAGAGASVPLLGFGHLLFQGVKDAVKESGFLGLFQGGLKAGAVGTSAALIFAYLASWIFQPKMKK